MDSGFAANHPSNSDVAAGEVVETTEAVGNTAGSRGTRSVLDAAIEATAKQDTAKQTARPAESAAQGFLERFLSESSTEKALALWLGDDVPESKDRLARLLNRDIARIDQLLTDQVNAVLHHEQFQQLEAGWRSLSYLVEQVEDGSNVKVRAMHLTWKELSRDMERALEFDRSQFFSKVYSEEFGTPGGEPFSVLLGNYEVHPRLTKDHSTDDIATLRGISQVAAAAFCPFIASANPAMFGLKDFGGLERNIDFERVFDQTDYLQWNRFREEEDSRFIGLTLPRVLARLPYEDDGSRVDGFRYREDVAGPDKSKFLWGNAAFGFGAVLIRSFNESGWLAGIRGVQRGVDGGGLVTGLPVHSFGTDAANVIQKMSTDVTITDFLEKPLSGLGFIPLCHCKDTEFSAFYTNSSVQKPKVYDNSTTTMTSKISAMLQYMLCVSRFAHYVKVLVRDKTGSFAEAEDCEDFLQRWLVKYVTDDDDATTKIKSRFPLRQAQVKIQENPGEPGNYLCVIHLWPHYELDDLTAAIRVRAELAPKS